ncbi:MAG TPA: glycoside hydrolase family 15 protein [Chthoniobacterales bacterium]|jgi:GH15 family glucan-1,4-alpha-glucosidase
MSRIEDYAFLSDTQTAALVNRDGSVDWLCLPRFDSSPCFAALIGRNQNGRWKIAPSEKVTHAQRRYRGDSLILETELETESGVVRLIDFMPPRGKNPDMVRIVEGVRGTVQMQMELIIRFDYGDTVPWVRSRNGALEAIAGPNALILRTPIETRGENLTTVAEFTIAQGDRMPFVLTWFASHHEQPREIHPEHALRDTEKYWHQWARRCDREGPWTDAVVRSLVTLKGLTYEPTGGIVAAATTSLPEEIGGVRNWDYRYCWLRDATLTLYALVSSGYEQEARSWREWLLRAIAGSASQMQILYGVSGERRLEEYEIPWLDGYENSKPVRVGNAASNQFQLDVYGEIMGSLYHAHRSGMETASPDWQMQLQLMKFLESHWDKPDDGIWEVRGGRQQFTHSKMMAWMAFDRAIKMVEQFNCSGHHCLEGWRALREKIHAEVCQRGYKESKRAFTQSYDSDALDASILMMPMIGFLPASDARVRSTVEAVERELIVDGFVLRYRPEETRDGLTGGEGAFLPCSFWLADCLHLLGRKKEARDLFERLLGLRNDLGLLAEEYDPVARRQLGNFPQAFSHVMLVNSAGILGDNPKFGPQRPDSPASVR